MKKPRNKRRKNPPLFLTDHQMGQIAGDLVIERNFGLFGLLLSHGMPKLREAMLRTSIMPDSVPTGTTEPASTPEGANRQKGSNG